MKQKRQTVILFSGGGTLGPVTPLLALHERFHTWYPATRFVWIGTRKGPEKGLVEEVGMRFFHLPSAKFRRYLSLWNILDILRLCVAFFQAIILLIRIRPAFCISAGGFVSVPVHLAAWILGIPTWVHQQDREVGLANRMMSPFARVITTATESSLAFFSKKKRQWMGNPVRRELFLGDAPKARERFHLSLDLPVLFVTGGGTGSQRVNELVLEALETLRDTVQVIHLTGVLRSDAAAKRAEASGVHYQSHRFFTHEMAEAYAVADLVISRGGFGTISELAALKKASILIPKPGHQEENVRWLAKEDAVIFFDERIGNGLNLAQTIHDLLNDSKRRKKMGERLHVVLPVATDQKIKETIEELLGVKR